MVGATRMTHGEGPEDQPDYRALPDARAGVSPLARTTYEARIARVQEAMRSADLGALFVAPSADLEYLTGELRPTPTPTSSAWPLGWLAGAWIRPAGEPLLTVPRMASDYSWANALEWPLQVISDSAESVTVLKGLVDQLGLSGKHIALGDRALARTALDLVEASSDIDVVSEPSFVQRVRSQKDGAEIEILREVSRITDEAFRNVVGRIKPGLTERDLVEEITYQLGLLGSRPAYPIGAWGWGATYPRTVWDRRVMDIPVVAPNVFAFDFGAWWKGYCTDFCRVVHLSDPGPEVRSTYAALVAVQDQVIAELKPDGRTAEDIYRIGMDLMREAGLDQYFPDRLGHGIGMDIHEVPSLFVNDQTPIASGMVVTIEPQVFNGPIFLGIEDLVLIGADGGQRLTLFGSEQIIVE
jgi:Xaa-Pro aminopeptidase